MATEILFEGADVIRFDDHVSLRIMFNNGRTHAADIKNPLTPKQIGEHLIKLGQHILHDPNLKEIETT